MNLMSLLNSIETTFFNSFDLSSCLFSCSFVHQAPTILLSSPQTLVPLFGTITIPSLLAPEVNGFFSFLFSYRTDWVWLNWRWLCCFLLGPILLEDYHLVEKLANFDRERIPERVVHARGASAKGFFEVTHDISHLTCADFLRAPGVQTPVIVRFSTVIHERGSPETLRDPWGFAVKFYTREVTH